MLEGDIEKVAAAAGGIEDAHLAERAVKGLDARPRPVELALPRQGDGRRQHRFPVGAQRLDHRRHDQAFDVFAGGVVGAEIVAVAGIEGAFQQRAEDGRFDILPVGLAGLDEQAELRFGQRKGLGFLEQAAVEAQQLLPQDGGEAAVAHRLPEGFRQRSELVGGPLQALQQAGEALFRDQADVLGEHGEEAALEKVADLLGRMARLLQGLGQAGELVGDLAGDPGAVPGGIEPQGVGPGQLQALADFGTGEILQPDAVRAGIGEGEIGLAGAGKFAVDLQRMADIDHDEKGGPALLLRQRPGILLGLAAGGEHGVVPAGGAAHRRPPAPSGGEFRARADRRRAGRFPAWPPGRSSRACRGRCVRCWCCRRRGGR